VGINCDAADSWSSQSWTPRQVWGWLSQSCRARGRASADGDRSAPLL